MIQPDNQPQRTTERCDQYGNVWLTMRPVYGPSNMRLLNAIFDRVGRGSVAAVDAEDGRVWVIGPDAESLAIAMEELELPTECFVLYRKLTDVDMRILDDDSLDGNLPRAE